MDLLLEAGLTAKRIQRAINLLNAARAAACTVKWRNDIAAT